MMYGFRFKLKIESRVTRVASYSCGLAISPAFRSVICDLQFAVRDYLSMRPQGAIVDPAASRAKISSSHCAFNFGRLRETTFQDGGHLGRQPCNSCYRKIIACS